MVIVDIYGGLGNQMFQYAIGRHLAQILGTKLKYDYSWNLIRPDFNSNDIPAIFDIFNVKGERATILEIIKFKAPGNRNYFIRKSLYVINKCIRGFQVKCNVINESDFHFNEDILLTSDNCYLSGYWQSEKYFKGIENLIREDFQMKPKMDEKNLRIAKKIFQTESVSIHLRGRDYITKEEVNRKHFTCDYSYYEKGISLINKKILNPHFFIFSDDPIWAKAFLKKIDNATFVEGNSWNKSSYEDLRLMSLCKHNIIANSSFSWWGAWLNQSPEKIIIAPKKWFNDITIDTSDIIPDNWIRI
jgi:hypothetical protein